MAEKIRVSSLDSVAVESCYKLFASRVALAKLFASRVALAKLFTVLQVLAIDYSCNMHINYLVVASRSNCRNHSPIICLSYQRKRGMRSCARPVEPCIRGHLTDTP